MHKKKTVRGRKTKKKKKNKKNCQKSISFAKQDNVSSISGPKVGGWVREKKKKKKRKVGEGGLEILPAGSPLGLRNARQSDDKKKRGGSYFPRALRLEGSAKKNKDIRTEDFEERRRSALVVRTKKKTRFEKLEGGKIKKKKSRKFKKHFSGLSDHESKSDKEKGKKEKGNSRRKPFSWACNCYIAYVQESGMLGVNIQS